MRLRRLFPVLFGASGSATPTGPVLVDHFTGADGTLLQNHTPDTAPGGSAWAVVSGGNFTLSGNRCSYTGGVVAIDTGIADFTLTAKMWVNTGGAVFYAFVFRLTDSSHFWHVQYNRDSTTLQMHTNDGGFVSRAMDDTVAYPGDGAEITITAKGNDVSVTYGGKTISYSSSFNASATKIGLRNGGAAAGTLDDLQVVRA